MGQNEPESKLDEIERDNLQAMISRLETAMAVSTPDIRSGIKKILQGAKERLGNLEVKIKEAEAERETRSREQATAIAELAQREAALSEKEREVYSGFLAKEFFTKADFGELERFYSTAWDRLSERGKDEMSHRIWEGARRGEYSFAELPETVRKKEAERLYLRLDEGPIADPALESIPAKDRADFIRAYESRNERAAAEVLSRRSFAENLGSRKEASRCDASSRQIKHEEKTIEAGARKKESADKDEVEGGIAALDGSEPPVKPIELARSKAGSLTR